jgi:hypothetical protein
MAATATVREKRESGGAARPHDERTDVKLAGDWLDRWLLELDHHELKAYLQLAHYYNTRTYHDAEALGRILPGKEAKGALERLEKRGLVEVIRKEGKNHYHFPHRAQDGFHRAERARPSLADALRFQESMSSELLELTSQDETDELRERAFARYPQLREEWELYESAADDAAPRWRLWMEVSRHLIREFERRFGSLKEDHGALFKELSANVLRHRLEMVEGCVKDVLERIDELFPEVQRDWVIAPSEEEFQSLPFARRLAQRYGIGPEQIFVSAVEALGNQGKLVVSVDEAGGLAGMVLPTDTGLTKSEERVLFLKPEERHTTDSPRNQERVKRARNKYANYLIDRAVACLADFVAAGRVRGIDGWLERVVELVNEALGLLPMSDGRPIVQLEHVIDRFDALRQGIKPRGAANHSGNGGVTKAAPAKAEKAPAKAQKKAAPAKAAKKAPAAKARKPAGKSKKK